MDYVITSDNTCDLPADYYEEHGIPYLKLSYIIDGNVLEGNADFDYRDFYDKLRGGLMPTTSQVTILDAKQFFEKFLKDGKDILHIAFSSGLSGTYNSCCVAAEELKEEYPDRSIVVIDSLAASLGEGLLLHYAILQRDAGKTMVEVADYVEGIKKHICHFFTVDDLNHLYRGGRVSRLTAFAGTIIGIKPVLHVDDEGKLVAIGKVRGRKGSLKAIVDHMENNMIPDKNDIIFICHGDCEEEAELVKKMVQERYGIEAFLINPVGPVIGAHSGPGTMSVFFVGQKR